jgi:hypothetical protein
MDNSPERAALHAQIDNVTIASEPLHDVAIQGPVGFPDRVEGVFLPRNILGGSVDGQDGCEQDCDEDAEQGGAGESDVSVHDDTPFHKAVELVLLRMDSHPEEFAKGIWATTMLQLNKHCSKAELAAMTQKYNSIMMDSAYIDMCKRIYGVDDECATEATENLDPFSALPRGIRNQPAPRQLAQISGIGAPYGQGMGIGQYDQYNVGQQAQNNQLQGLQGLSQMHNIGTPPYDQLQNHPLLGGQLTLTKDDIAEREAEAQRGMAAAIAALGRRYSKKGRK